MSAHNKGYSFSTEEYVCDCYNTAGPPDSDCNHPTEKRGCYVDELTDAQLKFLFYAQQEREKMKKESADSGGDANTPNVPSSAAGTSAAHHH